MGRILVHIRHMYERNIFKVSIKRLDDLVDIAKKSEKKTVIAVVEAHDENTLESIVSAAKEGIATAKLIGKADKIKSILTGLGAGDGGFDIIAADSVEESLSKAVKMIDSGDAAVLMKGKLESAEYIKALVKKENRLVEDGGMLSVTGLFSPPKYHKLLAVSDPALNTYPDLEGKKAIVKNAVRMLNALGYENPKVAALAAIEKLNPKMQDTVDALALKKMNQSGEIRNCIIEGPISFDLAICARSAKIKGYDSPVAGDADLLLVPEIAAGNLLVKTLTILAGAQTAGCVLGAKVPAILVSRSAEASDKYYSIALAACVAAMPMPLKTVR